jgi:hypothetical protein
MNNLKVMPLKTIPANEYFPELAEYANFSSSGSVKEMKDKYYGKYALLVKCGKFIYNVSSNPHIYHNVAK